MALRLELSGGTGNTAAAGSIGLGRSGTNINDSVNENLLDDISRKEVLVGKTEYRCYYVFNDSSTKPVHGAILFIDLDPTSTIITMGLDPVGSGNGTTTGVAQGIATEDTTPTGVTFEDAGEFRVKLGLPLIRPLESQAIWIKRVAAVGPGGPITIGVTSTGNEEVIIPADLTINDNTVANPTLVTTTSNHNLVTGNQITITGSDSTPTIDGEHIVTLIDSDTFSIPINVTIVGSTGTVAIGGNILEIDGSGIGERTSIETVLGPFLIGTARIGFSEMG